MKFALYLCIALTIGQAVFGFVLLYLWGFNLMHVSLELGTAVCWGTFATAVPIPFLNLAIKG